jgi:ubiquitin carboxyl-terminal hydrolase 14
LTGVPVERQKLMGFPGGNPKDDVVVGKLKEGLKVTLIGNADELSAPKEKIVFVEDIVKDGDEDSLLHKYPAGLNNIGNTCYLNACLQNLKSIPEIKSNLKGFT